MSKVSKFFKNIFHPKSGLYSILLGLMSFLAILISLLTLQEMKAQRELSIMPIIRIQDFDNKKIHVDSSCVEMIYGDEIKLDESEETQYGVKNSTIDKLLVKEWFALSLINIGEGSAVNIEVEWKVNYEWFLDYFNSLNIDPDIFNVKSLKKGFYFMYKNCSNVGTGASHSTDNTFKKSHLLSASNNVKGIKVPIPQIMLDLHVATIKGKWLVEGQTESNIINSPIDHEFVISYESVNGNKYSERYNAKLVLTPPGMKTIIEEGGVKIVSASYEKFILELLIEKI